MFSDNLKKYRALQNLTQEQLAYKINELLIDKDYKKSNVQSWERDVSPKLDVIIAIAEILNIPEQFLFDDSKEAINKIISSEAPKLKEIVEHTLRIPLLDGYVGAGSAGIMDVLKVNEYVYIDNSSIKRKYANETIIALPVVGDSMTPYVNEDDIILFNPIKDKSYNLSDGKYVIQTINGTMVKNLKFMCNGNIVISSCNKAYGEEIINSDESQEFLDILGTVVGRILKS
jgi:phage repressor protein C with HTH and peptisase S24 domain